MDKPQSLSVKDYLIRKMAVNLMVPEKTIEAVISHQFNEANVAMRTNDSVELSGFGKFLFNKKKAIKKMEKLLSKKRWFENLLTTELTEKQRNRTMVILESVNNSIEFLKPKLYDTELFSNSGGMEKQADSSSTSEGAYKGNEQAKNEDMQGL
jgi:nucleoid DNA-binding protein